jgi:hypothetical protein
VEGDTNRTDFNIRDAGHWKVLAGGTGVGDCAYAPDCWSPCACGDGDGARVVPARFALFPTTTLVHRGRRPDGALQGRGLGPSEHFEDGHDL